MSSCTLILSVKDGDRPLHAGDELEGEVVVKAARAGRCDGLRVELLVRTVGKGNDGWEVLTAVPLFVGEWSEETMYRYPFRLTVPPAPPPFKGELFTVSHVLRATADIPWAIDPKVDHPLTLAPSPEWRSAAATQDPVVTPFKGPVIGLLVVSYVLVFVLLYYRSPTLGLLFVPLGAIFLFPNLRNTISAWRTSKAVVTVPRRIHPGQAVPVLVELERFAPPLKAVSATLVCIERAVSGQGKDASVYERVRYEEKVVLTQSDIQTRFEGSFVPPNAPLWSFVLVSSSVRWTLRVQLECSGWPDWFMSWPLSMDPPETPALAAPPRP